MISSAAGIRLAKARAAVDQAEADDGASPGRLDAVRLEFALAAIAVSDELVAQGFHNMEDE